MQCIIYFQNKMNAPLESLRQSNLNEHKISKNGMQVNDTVASQVVKTGLVYY